MTLTQTALLTKRIIAISIILILLAIIGWFGYQYYYYNIYLPSIPKVVEKPDTKFGILPKIPAPKTTFSPSNYSYSIDTKTGALPEDFPKLFKVYFIPQLSTTLLASEKAKDLAQSLKFDNGPELVTPTEYRFTDKNGASLLVDITTGNFRFNRSIATESAVTSTDSATLQDNILSDQAKLVQDFKNFLTAKGLLKEQLQNGRSKIIYSNTSAQDSTTALVTLWQDNIDQYPIITPQFSTGLIKGSTTKYQEETKKFVSLDYTYWQVDKNTFSTYPLRSIDQALNDLKSGQGAVLMAPQGARVSLQSAYLAYILSEDYFPYLQPVYVFEGPEFAAWISAISAEFIEK